MPGCKQGDLAFINRGAERDKIVEVVRLWDGKEDIAGHHYRSPNVSVDPYWIIRGKALGVLSVNGTLKGTVCERPCPDVWLNPIRPSDEQDETLAWKTLPAKPEAITTPVKKEEHVQA